MAAKRGRRFRLCHLLLLASSIFSLPEVSQAQTSRQHHAITSVPRSLQFAVIGDTHIACAPHHVRGNCPGVLSSTQGKFPKGWPQT